MKSKIKALIVSTTPTGTTGVGGFVKTAMIGTQSSIDWVCCAQGLQTQNNRPAFLPNTNIKLYPFVEYPDVAQLMDVLHCEKPDVFIHTDDFWKHAPIRGSLKHFSKLFSVKCVWWGIQDAAPAPLEQSEELDKWDAVIGLTKLSCAVWREMLGKNSPKIHYVPHPIDTHRLVKRERNTALEQRMLLGRDYDFVVLSVGNNQTRKRQPALIYAFCEWARSLKKEARSKVALICKIDRFISDHGTNLERVAQRYGGYLQKNPHSDLANVHLIRRDPDNRPFDLEGMVDLYNLADFVCQPSSHEGFGLPVSEALATETPVIANGCGGIAEQVSPEFAFVLSGSENFVCDANGFSVFEDVLDWRQLRDALDAAYKMKKEVRAKWGKLGRAHVIANYESGMVCDMLVDTLRKILAPPVVEYAPTPPPPAKKKAVKKPSKKKGRRRGN